jgi:hypothetical protein
LLEPIERNWQRVAYRSFRAKKRIYQLFDTSIGGERKVILFIIGCQRSGTTLLADIFEKDFRTTVHGEYSQVSVSSRQSSRQIRLKPLDVVKKIIDSEKVPLVVLKPLVETQHILKLLSFFDGSRTVWMYRDYRDVISSNLKHWGINNGVNNLRAIVENAPQNWRSENVSEQTRQIVLKYFSEKMNPYDAAALFWLVRNRLFFELELGDHPAVAMCKYEDLVTQPRRVMKEIYRFVGSMYPGDSIIADVHGDSRNKGESIKLSPEVELLCQEMIENLDRVHRSRTGHESIAANG